MAAFRLVMAEAARILGLVNPMKGMAGKRPSNGSGTGNG